MPIYNLLEYSDKYSTTSGSLQNYYRNKVKDSADENNDPNNYRINNNKTTASKSFEYKTELIGITASDTSKLNAEDVASLKYLSKFWISVYLLLINCEIELDSTWSKYYEISRTPEVEGANPVDKTLTTGVTFQINNEKLYVPVITLSINYNIIFLENIKQEYKRTISWTQIQNGNKKSNKKQ